MDEKERPNLHRRHRKEDADALGWRITNACDRAQQVLLCVYDPKAKDPLVNPFYRCDQEGFDIGTPFTVAGRGGRAEVDCRARDDGDYRNLILIGEKLSARPNEVPPPGVPHVALTHMLDIVIVP